jgi:hypothetical protein
MIKMAMFDGSDVVGVMDNRNVTPETAFPTFEREISETINDPSII